MHDAAEDRVSSLGKPHSSVPLFWRAREKELSLPQRATKVDEKSIERIDRFCVQRVIDRNRGAVPRECFSQTVSTGGGRVSSLVHSLWTEHDLPRYDPSHARDRRQFAAEQR